MAPSTRKPSADRAREIEGHPSDTQEPAFGACRRLAKPCSDTGDELGKREGLRQVVGSAGLQAADLGLDIGQCGKDQHPLAGADLHEVLQDRHPVEARQQEVQHDQLVAAGLRQLHSADPVRGTVHPEPLGRQSAGDEADDPRLVVDDQDARHERNARPGRQTGTAFMTNSSCPEPER